MDKTIPLLWEYAETKITEKYAQTAIRLVETTLEAQDTPRASRALRDAPNHSEFFASLYARLGNALGHIYDSTENPDHLYESNVLCQKAYATIIKGFFNEPKRDTELSAADLEILSWVRGVIEGRTLFGCSHCDVTPRSILGLDMRGLCLRKSFQFRDQETDMLTAEELNAMSLWYIALYVDNQIGKQLALALYLARQAVLRRDSLPRIRGMAYEILADCVGLWYTRSKSQKQYLDESINSLEEAFRVGEWSSVENIERTLTLSSRYSQRFKGDKSENDAQKALDLCSYVQILRKGEGMTTNNVDTMVIELDVFLYRYFLLGYQPTDMEQVRTLTRSLSKLSDLSLQHRLLIIQGEAVTAQSAEGIIQAVEELALRFARADQVASNNDRFESMNLIMRMVRMPLVNDNHSAAIKCFGHIFRTLPQINFGSMDSSVVAWWLQNLQYLSDLAGYTMLKLKQPPMEVIERVESFAKFTSDAMLRGRKLHTVQQPAEHHAAEPDINSLIGQLSLGDREPVFNQSTNEIVVTYFVGINSSKAIVLRAGNTSEIDLPRLKISILEDNLPRLMGGHRLSQGEAKSRASRNNEFRQVLQMLWDRAVQPIISKLDVSANRDSEPIPRIIWILRGIMGQMPLHAATNYDTTPAITVSNYGVCTYSESLKSLRASKAQDANQIQFHSIKASVFSFTKQAGHARELDTSGEIEAFQNCFPEAIICNTGPASSITALLQGCNVIHWASHGILDPRDPARSGLWIGDRNSSDADSWLSYFDILDIKNSAGQLAFLSACSTAANSSYELAQESRDLAAAFCAAGFKQIVASRWEIDDEVVLPIAREFYKEISRSENSLEGSDIAKALHRAIDGVRRKDRASEMDVLAWVPFIHLGS